MADLLPGMLLAGLGQGVAFTAMYVAASTGVTAAEQGVASAIASTAQQIGGSVGLAALVALLSERTRALGGPAGLTGQSAGVLTEALHATAAAQAGIAVLGAAVALLVVGGGRRPSGNTSATSATIVGAQRPSQLDGTAADDVALSAQDLAEINVILADSVPM